jgi:hypothetical protein
VWEFDAVLFTEPEDGGLVLKNVKHAKYQMATDIRVISVWVGSKGSDGAIQPYYLGSRGLPNTTPIQTNFLPHAKLFAAYPQLLEISTQFQTPGPAGNGTIQGYSSSQAGITVQCYNHRQCLELHKKQAASTTTTKQKAGTGFRFKFSHCW